MKAKIIEELKGITDGQLTEDVYGATADRIIKIIEDQNRSVAIIAVETVKKSLIDATAASGENKKTGD